MTFDLNVHDCDGTLCSGHFTGHLYLLVLVLSAYFTCFVLFAVLHALSGVSPLFHWTVVIRRSLLLLYEYKCSFYSILVLAGS